MRRLTRRALLQSAAAGAAAMVVHGPAGSLAAAPAPSAHARIGVLVDLTRCIGCRACMRACADRNDLTPVPTASVWEGAAQPLRYDRWTVVNLLDAGGRTPGVPVKQQCLHCLEPACVSVCPVGALERLESGAVIWKSERCIGCRYCVFACPFNIPTFQWRSGTAPVIGKCQFCAQGAIVQGPACAAACPTGALKFGPRESLLVEANARVRAHPERYVDHVYGAQEVGGTSWLYLSDRPFQRIGFPARLPRMPLPSLTWIALKVIPAVVTVLLCSLGILSYQFRRRHDAAHD